MLKQKRYFCHTRVNVVFAGKDIMKFNVSKQSFIVELHTFFTVSLRPTPIAEDIGKETPWVFRTKKLKTFWKAKRKINLNQFFAGSSKSEGTTREQLC